MILTRGRELIRERRRGAGAAITPEDHVQAALRWLGSAQDSSDDGGVSHSYLIGKRWMRSYPETTGYIIPTLLNCAASGAQGDWLERALRMADWELEVQLEDGAIGDLMTGAPVVFDTGQVLFGFVSAWDQTGELRYRDAARRAAEWLLAAMDDDGVWRSANDSGGPGRVYNARAAWAVLEYATRAGDDRCASAVRRFLDWTLGQERTPGWYDHNCLNQDATPLLHTIAYTARGQLECGILLQEPRYVDASRRTVERLAGTVREDGFMPGRYDHEFRGVVGWACLTGMAQTSILWQRHAALGTGSDHRDCAARVNRFLARIHDLDSTNPGLRGGVRGSFPVHAEYGQWSVLNWATKFFIDALMLELNPDFVRFPG